MLGRRASRTERRWQGNLVLVGRRRPDARPVADLARSRARFGATGITHVTGRRPRRRVALRHAAHRARLEAVVLPQRVAAAVGARRRPRLVRDVRREAAGPDGGAALPRRACARAGVTVHGGLRVGVASAQAVPLAQIASAPLAELVRYMDLHSDNFTAEMLLKQLGAVAGRRGTTAAGAAVRAATARRGRRAARRACGSSTAPASRCSTA